MQVGNFPVTQWLSSSIYLKSDLGDSSRSGDVDGACCGHPTFRNCGSCYHSGSADAGASTSGGLRIPGPLGSFACGNCCQQKASVDHASEPLAWKQRRGIAEVRSSERRKTACYVAAAAALQHPTTPPSPRTPAPSLLPTVRCSLLTVVRPPLHPLSCAPAAPPTPCKAQLPTARMPANTCVQYPTAAPRLSAVLVRCRVAQTATS
jgi:hypothetical protein